MSQRSLLPTFVMMAALLAMAACGPTSSDYLPIRQYDAATQPPGSDAATQPPGSDAATQPPGKSDAATQPPGSDAGTQPPQTDGGTTPPQPDGSTQANAPGTTCTCDGDCASVGGQAGTCVFGICMIAASTTCSAAGSTAECPTGSRCWGLSGYSGSICWPDCASFGCAGDCDGDGSCVASVGMDCDYSCGSYCSCQPGDCGVNEQCVNGACTPTVNPPTGGPGPGPGPSCPNLPPLLCTGGAAYCGAIIPFEPVTGPGYDNYPLNGETASNQYRSYLRRDLVMLIKYATAKVACKTANWTFGDNWPLGLGDMSESNGAIPGTSINQPGHPAGTHVDGHDIDIGYYQLGQSNNYLRAICDHYSGGQDAYHCTSAPTGLDEWRSALFLGFLTEHPSLRVVGCDGQAGPLLEGAVTQLCADGWLDPSVCGNVPLAYETTDQGYGWFHFHHHHMHVSLSTPSYKSASTGAMPCKAVGCPTPISPLPVKRRAH